MKQHHDTSARGKAWVLSVIASLSLVASVTTATAQMPTEVGIWLDDTGQGAVEVYVCMDRADRLCGRIVWLRDPLNAEGRPKRDRYNPNESMQNRPICGLPVLGNLARVSEGGFDGGWIYDPKVGKSYNAAILAQQSDRLTVTGYLGLKLLGKSFTWTRAPQDLGRCENNPAAPAPIKGGKPAAPAPNKASANAR